MRLTFASSLVVVVALAMMAPTQAAVLPTTNEAEFGKPGTATTTLGSQIPSPTATNGGNVPKSKLQQWVESFNTREHRVDPDGHAFVHPKSTVSSATQEGRKPSDSTTSNTKLVIDYSKAPQKPVVKDQTGEDPAAKRFNDFMFSHSPF
ncbi:hypothetical protein FB446DRAFT_282414 [Lentinula raphanica]|nr:hypothetical protein FB446DRAFT_282414 [Lentinula raphanica]